MKIRIEEDMRKTVKNGDVINLEADTKNEVEANSVSELQIKSAEWKALARQTEAQRLVAEEYYEKNLMGLIAESYIERNSDLVVEEVRYLVMSVGTSYEPLVLNIKLLNPEKILFLYTEKSAGILDKIVDFCELSTTEYEKSLVNEVNPIDIYREIKKCYLDWKKPDKMYIDFTGGTKAMSAAAALAGALIDVQLIYAGTNDYLPDFRKPNPGSEQLFYIDNPLAIFGDLEIEKALVLFDRYNFAGAQEKLEVLKEDIPDPNLRTQLNFVYLLAKAYEAWDSLDFEEAYKYMCRLNKELFRDRMHKEFMLMNERSRLSKQEEILALLNEIPGLIKERRNAEILKDKDVIHALMFTMFQNAEIREYQEKYDMATLLFYRLLEMIEQCRLSQYNLFVSKMDYMAMRPDVRIAPEYTGTTKENVDTLKGNVGNIRAALFGGKGDSYLQEQVSLLDGFVILLALKDPIIYDGTERGGIILLKKIRTMVYLRNNSIFAHGLGPVGYDEYKRFSLFVTELFKGFCRLEKTDFNAYSADMKNIKLLKEKLPLAQEKD